MKGIRCVWCGCQIAGKDIIGINRKLLGTDTTEFYCLQCFAEYLCCEVSDIEEKIAEFKEQGCTLFQ